MTLTWRIGDPTLADKQHDDAIVSETLTLIREREREHREDLEGCRDALLLVTMHAEDARDDLQEDALASLAALSHAHALAQEGTAMGALDRLADVLVRFESRCRKGDVAGAVVWLRACIAKLSGPVLRESEKAATG